MSSLCSYLELVRSVGKGNIYCIESPVFLVVHQWRLYRGRDGRACSWPASNVFLTFDNDKSAPHFKWFQIAVECTIRRLRFIFNFLRSSNFKKTSFQIASECTIKRLRFKTILSSSNFRKHRINSVRMQHLVSF